MTYLDLSDESIERTQSKTENVVREAVECRQTFKIIGTLISSHW